MDESNYDRALKWVDYIVCSESSLDQRAIGRLAKQLKVPREEFQNILELASQGKGGISVVSPNWIHDSLDENRLIDDKYYRIYL